MEQIFLARVLRDRHCKGRSTLVQRHFPSAGFRGRRGLIAIIKEGECVGREGVQWCRGIREGQQIAGNGKHTLRKRDSSMRISF